ncbi:MAG: hypothetical protein ACE5QW_07420 [Thermoplasmata archaeon]
MELFEGFLRTSILGTEHDSAKDLYALCNMLSGQGVDSVGKKSERVKDIAGMLGLGMIFATGLMTIITWLVAWWNGVTTGSYTVLVNINAAGEMFAEFWLIWIVLGFAIWGMYWYIHEAMLEEEELE